MTWPCTAITPCLFVAQLKLGFDDVDTFASNSLTDGSNDKKCDLVAVVGDTQRVILAQGYMSTKNGVGAAPANKATDLNAGASWLLAGELAQALKTADGILKRDFSNADVDVSAIEIGMAGLEEEYARIQAPILVSDEFTFTVPGGFEILGEDWSAFSTAIAVADLRELWTAHKTRLMSPNIRDFLGELNCLPNNTIRRTRQ
jgi:hypothetical protein